MKKIKTKKTLVKPKLFVEEKAKILEKKINSKLTELDFKNLLDFNTQNSSIKRALNEFNNLQVLEPNEILDYKILRDKLNFQYCVKSLACLKRIYTED
ncbi:MAG: hypothetical protein V1824_01585, partial [archaeon]